MKFFRKCSPLLFLALVSCYRAPLTLDPCLVEPMHPKEAMHQGCITFNLPPDFSISPFAQLDESELAQDWGKELKLGYLFANDFDLYRAITTFKRALFLMPPELTDRRLETEYDIALCYFLGKKYLDCIKEIENSELVAVDGNFVAFSDLLLILYDSYRHECMEEKAQHILSLIERFDACDKDKLILLNLVENGCVNELSCLPLDCERNQFITNCMSNYQLEKKSVRKAEFLNAICPGAGYWYVGQKQTAFTAFLVNSLFIAAGVEFITHGYEAAGIITLSLESGWYLGGIYGGGLAAKSYNEHLYRIYAERITTSEKLYPAMMLKFTF
jgi:hypothetical protein